MNFTSKNNKLVHYNKNFFVGNTDALRLAGYSIENMDLGDEDFIKTVSEFDKIIGKNNCVETTKDDMIVMATRRYRNNKTRFVLCRKGVDTNKLTILIKRRKGKLTLVGAYFGEATPKEIEDPSLTEDEYKESNEFWSKHALVFNTQIIDIKKSAHLLTFVVGKFPNLLYAGNNSKLAYGFFKVVENLNVNVSIWIGGKTVVDRTDFDATSYDHFYNEVIDACTYKE